MSPNLAGFYPDPTLRYEERYWDGTAWAGRVRDEGIEGFDRPLADLADVEPGHQLGARRARPDRTALIIGCAIAAVIVLTVVIVGFIWFSSNQF